MLSRVKLPFVALLAFLVPSFASAQWAPTAPSISVSGSAEVRVAPDEAELTVGVDVRNASLDVATEQTNGKVASVIKFLKSAGVDSADIQTDFVNVGPTYRNDDVTTPTYYTAHRNIGVRVRKVADIEKLVAGALKSGATNIGGLEFRTTELRKHRDAARQLALRAAKEKAEAMGKELGVEVGKVQSISESSSGGYWGGRGHFNQMTQNVVQNFGGNAGEGDGGALAVGQISVSASVHVVFQLK